MKIRTTLVALALVVVPTLGLAQGCGGFEHKAQSANACEAGQTFNETLGICVATPTG